MRTNTTALIACCAGVALGSMSTFVLMRPARASADHEVAVLPPAPVVPAEAPPPEEPKPPEPQVAEVPSTDAVAKPEPRGYVLDTDIPWVNQRMTTRVKRLVEKAMADRDAEYEALFKQLGIPPGARAEIKDRIAQLYRKKAEAGIIMSEWSLAQGELGRHLGLYSAEARDAYFAFEDATQAKTEADNVAAFFESKGAVLTESARQSVQAAIQSEGTYTMKTLGMAGSPFDPPMIPFTGRAIIPNFEKTYLNMAAGSASVLKGATGLSDEERKILEQYFAAELARYDDAIRQANEGGYGRGKR